MTASSALPPTVSRLRRRSLTALATAEYLQFRRNKTLIYLGTVFPVGVPIVQFFLQQGHVSEAAREVNAFEVFAVTALLLVQYYSVLSLVTTRRGEGVLKRLRTGEAADWQIQAAPAVPGAILTLAGTVLIAVVTYAAGSPAPINPFALVFALAAGLVVFSLLALATSAVTKNAEAAQITAIPVLALTILGMASIRTALPDPLVSVVNWTPFAAVSDLISLGVAGRPATATAGTRALDFVGTFGEVGRPLVTLAVWAVLALVLTRRFFSWDQRS